MYEEIPQNRPSTPLLDSIESTSDLRALDERQLIILADELRHYLLYSVGQTGGHFGAGLGVVELTIALHFLYDTPYDRLVWDVGHQAYPHKILTGRRDAMLSMRQEGGLSGFPKRSESEYDTFGVGHSSTSIGAAQGMAMAARLKGECRRTVAVIGDGAMTAGMAFEALAHAAHTQENMMVVLNDNNMSISKNVGGLANYFAKIWSSKTYIALRKGSHKVLSKIPQAWELARKTEEHVKGMISPGTLFEELGFNYVGPLDGHDLPSLISTMRNMRDLEGPQLLHIITRKGKGFGPAERDPIGYHALTKIEPKQTDTEPKVKKLKFQDIFGQWLCDSAAQDERLVAITPAMSEGSGMLSFADQFQDRFFDVAIAEQHAVTLAAGLACESLKPVVAIYSTFLQRGYDQLIHDVAIQNLDVTFAIDRAGLVGEDGATHAGAYDLSYLRCIPNMVIAVPSDEAEARLLLESAYQYQGPAAIRYPRGSGTGSAPSEQLDVSPVGKSKRVREGCEVAILCFGTLLDECLVVANALNATLIDMRWVKPLDAAAIDMLVGSHQLVVTVEVNAIAGGAGSAVSEYLNQQRIAMEVLQLGLPDRCEDHAPQNIQLRKVGLDSSGILAAIETRLQR
jgi:1-deoxy-D-xylulose-5-phosphate synthase